ncbi:hypothetical protein Rhopal_007128-T1 [Rhodotorula paludigena]|uniref:Non-specific serine/threonine protein kinase n=1 Tax=Rhodotorula paludigena TaxID=86838 RepID=A0AAV5GVS1_9BASI|nr:hypothetical protein Rhopal_007128-T1 [Rhodotorula paludigena]
MRPVDFLATSLRLAPSPYSWPPPPDVYCPTADFTSSAHAASPPHLVPHLARYAPEIVQRVVRDFLDGLDEALERVQRNEPFSASLVAGVQSELASFGSATLVSCEESDIAMVFQPLWSRVVGKIVHELEARLGVYLTGQWETPVASSAPDGGGLFVKLEEQLARDGAVLLTHLEDQYVRKMVKKACISARVYGNSHFFLADGLSFFVGATVPLSSDKDDEAFELLLSSRHALATAFPKEAGDFLLFIIAIFFPSFRRSDILSTYRSELELTVPFPSGSPAEGKSLVPASNRVAEENFAPSKAATGETPSRGTQQFALIYPDGTTTNVSETPPLPWLGEGSTVPPLHALSEALSNTLSPAKNPYLETLASTFAAFLASTTEIRLDTFSGEGVFSRAYRFNFSNAAPHAASYVLKVARVDGAEALEREAALLFGVLNLFEKDVVLALKRLIRGDGRQCLIVEDGGAAPDKWKDLSEPQRLSLFVSMLRIHQRAHVQHGDIAPRNTVFKAPTPSDPLGSPRWIDWGSTEPHEACAGVRCGELDTLLGELDLSDEAIDEARTQAQADGLTWG